ncbi:MAG: hypothetical protein ACQER4_04565 [Bacteroidota bacterium]
MIRWIVIALFIYLMLRLISGPRRSSERSRFKVQFGTRQAPRNPRQQKQSMDQIEEAEYEDITETDNSEQKES